MSDSLVISQGVEKVTTYSLREEERLLKHLAEKEAAREAAVTATPEVHKGVLVSAPKRNIPRPVRTSSGRLVTDVEQDLEKVAEATGRRDTMTHEEAVVRTATSAIASRVKQKVCTRVIARCACSCVITLHDCCCLAPRLVQRARAVFT